MTSNLLVITLHKLTNLVYVKLINSYPYKMFIQRATALTDELII
jgi:hypothetical protein